MDLLLAHGYFLSLDAEEQRVMRPHPPLGLLYLSSHLKRAGIDVGVFDGTFRSLEDFARHARSRAAAGRRHRRQPDDQAQRASR